MADLLPDESAAAAVASDDAVTQNPRLGPLTFDPQGRVNNQDIEFGTNPPVISTIESQSVNPEGFAPQYGTTGGEREAFPGGDPGVGAPSDDSGTRQNTTQIINTAFNSKITPQPNILDQYASYTYNLSWYLMQPGTYKTLLESKKKSLAGMQLLAQSGGAPAGTAGATSQNNQGPGAITTNASVDAGRNSFFNLDYYLDNLEIESLITGGGNRMAHNATNIRFTVTEPNGITLINNLYQAVSSVYKQTNIPYAIAQYCLVVRFYGYDDNGNLVQVGKDRNSSTDARAVVEKFYPFLITNIKFRLANKIVEYNVEAKAIPHTVGFGQDLGTVKAPFELTGTTVKDVLSGTTVGQTSATGNDGRVEVPQVEVGSGVTDAQNASNTDSYEFTNTQQPNLIGTNIPGVANSF